MNILVTGADGFIGRNLVVRLSEFDAVSIQTCTRETSDRDLESLVREADLIFHLAGVNRTPDESRFDLVNRVFTETLCRLAEASGRKPPIVLSSSIQAALPNAYGVSKLAAEKVVAQYGREIDTPVYIYRLPNVFGKWCKPDYNSVVATFCHRQVNGQSLEISESERALSLVYIDDVIDSFLGHLEEATGLVNFVQVEPVYTITVGELAETIRRLGDGTDRRNVGEVGSGLDRALYATYLSHMTPSAFSYPLEAHTDQRGRFVELIKTPMSGQCSVFTAKPGITRGGHYHHTKSEKFFVVQGTARFRLRDISSDQNCELTASASEMCGVEIPPGWAHEITNIGEDELIVLLWANEIFDPEQPDTIGASFDVR